MEENSLVSLVLLSPRYRVTFHFLKAAKSCFLCYFFFNAKACHYCSINADVDRLGGFNSRGLYHKPYLLYGPLRVPILSTGIMKQDTDSVMYGLLN